MGTSGSSDLREDGNLTFEHIKHKEEGSCSICLQDFKKRENLLRIKDCSHVFHPSCLKKWLKSKDTCPLCRTYIHPDGETYIITEPNSSTSEPDIENAIYRSPRAPSPLVSPPRRWHDAIAQSPRPSNTVTEVIRRNRPYCRRILLDGNPSNVDSGFCPSPLAASNGNTEDPSASTPPDSPMSKKAKKDGEEQG